MGIFKRLFGGSDPDSIVREIQERINLPYEQYQSLEQDELEGLIRESMALYTQGLAADEAGQADVANRLYRRAFEYSPFNIEALDNCALNFILSGRTQRAIPLLEQSIAADPDSPLAYRYLIHCNREVGSNQEAFRLIKAYQSRWPGDSPFVDMTKREEDQHRAACAPFQQGQVWQYKTRESDPASRIWIRFLDEIAPGEYAAHVSVTNVAAPNSDKKIFASHLPVAIDALKESVTELSDEQQTWETEDDVFGSGYRMWFEAFSEGKAGVFTIPMAEIIDGVVQAVPPEDG